MKKLNVNLAIILFFIGGCTGCQQSGSQNDEIISVDVTASYPEKELILQDIMDVEYVPLETTDEFITHGIVEAVGKEFLLVRNRNDGNIFVFDRKTGKGLRKINRLGQGAEEYSGISGIILDEDNNELFVVDYTKKILTYDLSGNFKRSFKFADNSHYDDVFDYDREHLITYKKYYGTPEENRQACHILFSKQDGSVTRAIPLPFDIIKAPFVQKGDMVAVASVRSITPDQGNWLLADTSSDTVYRYIPGKDKLIPFIVKKPAENPDMFLTMGVNTGRYCFMQTIGKEFNFEKGRGFPTTDLMYDSREKVVFKPIVLNADYTTRKRVDLISRLGNEEVAAYEILSADRLVEAYGKGELKGGLKEIAAGLDEESNPVLMLVKHKR